MCEKTAACYFLRWAPAPRRLFDAMQSHSPFASSAGNGIMPGQKNVLALRHWQVSKSCTLPFMQGRRLCPVASLAGNEVMPYFSFARQETWCARGHGFARPRDSRLSETRLGFQVTPESKCARGARGRHHRNARLCLLSVPCTCALPWSS